MAAWNVRGMCSKEMQKEAKKFIKDEKLSIYAPLETHIKEKQLQRIYGFVYDRWNWVSDIKECERGCRIIVGWKEEDVNNVSLNIKDHSESGSCKISDMIDFPECIEHSEVEDLNCLGIYFTWVQSRHDPSSGILKKIDRVLGNVDFMSLFTNSHAIFLPHLASDHSSAILDKWKIQVKYKVVKKLKALKFHMKAVSWSYGNLHEKVIEWREKLQVIQRNVDKDPHNASLKKQEEVILKEYNTAKQDEDKLLVQKAKIDWLCDGDRNSKFFHNAKRSVSDEEVKAALFGICDNKAPRLDGYTAKFYKKAWPTIGSDVCDAIKEFFKTRKILGEVNATLITLVPKSSTPQRVSDYRLIACCNVLYNIISKILTNRIKKALCKVVNPSQSAFIPGR
ncbi:hypothetical protein Tco_0475428 [Tanacetum coccineum]